MANAMWARASRLLMAAAKAHSAPEAIPNINPNISTQAKGLLAPYPLSPQMKKFLGVSQISRPEAVKKVWEHIKQNNLQNPTNKKEIICDDKLKTIFDGRATVGILEIMKLMGPHFIKTK